VREHGRRWQYWCRAATDLAQDKHPGLNWVGHAECGMGQPLGWLWPRLGRRREERKKELAG
jgi:hypothetical protein